MSIIFEHYNNLKEIKHEIIGKNPESKENSL